MEAQMEREQIDIYDFVDNYMEIHDNQQIHILDHITYVRILENVKRLNRDYRSVYNDMTELALMIEALKNKLYESKQKGEILYKEDKYNIYKYKFKDDKTFTNKNCTKVDKYILDSVLTKQNIDELTRIMNDYFYRVYIDENGELIRSGEFDIMNTYNNIADYNKEMKQFTPLRIETRGYIYNKCLLDMVKEFCKVAF
jgi:hypothetical protein